METTKIVKKFGIKKVANDRYAIVINWEEKDAQGWGPTMDVRYSLSYKRPEFALKKAESFTRGLYRNHIAWHGKEQFVYEFVNIGEVK